jgi:homocysteine S-methyltransferase
VISTLEDLLTTGPWAIDGGLATELEARGHDLTGVLWSARVLAENPGEVREAHASYFRSGATIGISSSYQVSRSGFVRVGREAATADLLLRSSVELLKQARDEVRAEGISTPMLVAASVGPYGATLHDGSEYRGNYGLTKAELVDFHRVRLEVLARAEPDLLAIETIPDLLEAEALVEVLADFPRLPAWLSYSCADGAHLSAGQRFFDAVAVAVSAPTVRAVGVNCTAPEHVAALLAAGSGATAGRPYVVYPNAGRRWDGVSETWNGDGSDRFPPAQVRSWVDLGARLVGGCCGLGPAAIRQIAQTV